MKDASFGSGKKNGEDVVMNYAINLTRLQKILFDAEDLFNPKEQTPSNSLNTKNSEQSKADSSKQNTSSLNAGSAPANDEDKDFPDDSPTDEKNADVDDGNEKEYEEDESEHDDYGEEEDDYDNEDEEQDADEGQSVSNSKNQNENVSPANWNVNYGGNLDTDGKQRGFDETDYAYDGEYDDDIDDEEEVLMQPEDINNATIAIDIAIMTN